MINGRRFFFLLFTICIIAMFLTSCSGTAAPHSQIGPASLTAEQQDLISLLSSHSSEILLFDFDTLEPYTTAEFWLEIYSYGEFVEQIQGLYMINPEPQPLESRLAVIINRDRENQSFEWPFIKSNNQGSRISARFESPKVDTAGLARSFGPITESVAIQDSEEIVLYVSKFSRGSLRTFGDHQQLLEQPELMAQYTYAYIIKARFSTD